jgi:hypothetical protein
MEDIKINSQLDLKTYFNICILMAFKTRSLVLLVLYFALIQYFWFSDSQFNWNEEFYSVGIYMAFIGVMIAIVYLLARRNMAKVLSLREAKDYTINNEQIALKSETISSTVTWSHVVKFIEREKYFLLMPSSRAFYYLPKSGFQSDDDIAWLKNMVKEKGIKMSYH